MTKPKKTKEKAVLMTIDTVRIVEYDATNVMVERLEESTNNVTKETSNKWRFKGYSGTILGALRLIVKNEWLIDRNDVRDAKRYVEQVERSNAAILEVIET